MEVSTFRDICCLHDLHWSFGRRFKCPAECFVDLVSHKAEVFTSLSLIRVRKFWVFLGRLFAWQRLLCQSKEEATHGEMTLLSGWKSINQSLLDHKCTISSKKLLKYIKSTIIFLLFDWILRCHWVFFKLCDQISAVYLCAPLTAAI